LKGFDTKKSHSAFHFFLPFFRMICRATRLCVLRPLRFGYPAL
jgi:hypothetical protein